MTSNVNAKKERHNSQSFHPDNEGIKIPLHSISAIRLESRVFAAIGTKSPTIGHLLQIGHRFPEQIEGVDEEDGAVGVFSRLDRTVDSRDLGHVVEGRVEQFKHRRIAVRETRVVRDRL